VLPGFEADPTDPTTQRERAVLNFCDCCGHTSPDRNPHLNPGLSHHHHHH
jgi:hypothetical protein